MEQYQVATADGQTPLVMSGGHVVMQALSGQMSAGQTLQSSPGQVGRSFIIVLLPAVFYSLFVLRVVLNFCIISLILLYISQSVSAARNRLWVVAPSMLTGCRRQPMRQQQ